MSIIRTGSTQKYSGNWDKAFGGGKSKKKALPKKKATKKSAKKKAAAKKAKPAKKKSPGRKKSKSKSDVHQTRLF